MPLCNGIDLIKKVHQLDCPPQIIVVSGFDDYHLVRRALKLGVVDYLLKPIEVDEFKRQLNFCINNIKSHKKLSANLNRNQNVLQEIYENQHYINEMLSKSPDIENIYNRYNINPKSVCLVYILDVFVHLQPSDKDKQVTYFDILSSMDKCSMGSDILFLQGEYKKLWVVLIIGDKLKILKSSNNFQNHLTKKKTKFSYSITPINEISIAYDKCISSLSKYFYDMDMKENINVELYPYDNILGVITQNICEKKFVDASEDFRRFFHMACYNKTPINKLKKLLVNFIYTVMSEKNEFIKIVSRYKFTDYDITHIIQDATSCSKMCKGMIDTINIYIDQVKHEGNNDDYIIKKSKQYIDNAYMNDISLSYVAEKLGIHPNYLSTLFKNGTGVSYSQYLRDIRINKAKHLLKTTNRKLYDIAKAVGYNDSSHFHRVFKKETGISPGKYKKSL